MMHSTPSFHNNFMWSWLVERSLQNPFQAFQSMLQLSRSTLFNGWVDNSQSIAYAVVHRWIARHIFLADALTAVPNAPGFRSQRPAIGALSQGHSIVRLIGALH